MPAQVNKLRPGARLCGLEACGASAGCVGQPDDDEAVQLGAEFRDAEAAVHEHVSGDDAICVGLHAQSAVEFDDEREWRGGGDAGDQCL